MAVRPCREVHPFRGVHPCREEVHQTRRRPSFRPSVRQRNALQQTQSATMRDRNLESEKHSLGGAPPDGGGTNVALDPIDMGNPPGPSCKILACPPPPFSYRRVI